MRISDIQNKDDFICFLQEMSKDRKTNPTEWANPELPDYLDAISEWTKHMEQVYKNTHQEIPDNINWQFIATLFHVGRIYE